MNFDLHGRAGETHFCINGFARKLVLTEAKGNRQMAYCSRINEVHLKSTSRPRQLREKSLNKSFTEQYNAQFTL